LGGGDARPAAKSGATWTRYDNTWNNSLPLFPPGCLGATDPLGRAPVLASPGATARA